MEVHYRGYSLAWDACVDKTLQRQCKRCTFIRFVCQILDSTVFTCMSRGPHRVSGLLPFSVLSVSIVELHVRQGALHGLLVIVGVAVWLLWRSGQQVAKTEHCRWIYTEKTWWEKRQKISEKIAIVGLNKLPFDASSKSNLWLYVNSFYLIPKAWFEMLHLHRSYFASACYSLRVCTVDTHNWYSNFFFPLQWGCSNPFLLPGDTDSFSYGGWQGNKNEKRIGASTGRINVEENW